MTLAEQKAVVAHTSEAFSDTEPNVVTEAAKAVLKDSEARGGGVQMLGVDKIYPGSTVKALDDFNLEINPGEMVVLLGGSGCGKSTALRSLAGLEDIQAGRILVGGQDVTGVPINKRDMAMVFQAYSLFPHMTALQNVEFGLEIRGVDRAERRRQAMEKLELVGLADQAKKYTQQMSGGQQQRVALARALAVNPRVLLLDELLSALDAKVRVQLRDEIRRIQLEAGTTTVFVTHDQEEALAVADRIGVMNHGRIEQIADPQTLYRRPGTESVSYTHLAACSPPRPAWTSITRRCCLRPPAFPSRLASRSTRVPSTRLPNSRPTPMRSWRRLAKPACSIRCSSSRPAPAPASA